MIVIEQEAGADTYANPRTILVTLPGPSTTAGAIYADLQYQNQSTDNIWRTIRTVSLPVFPATLVFTIGMETSTPNAVNTGGFVAGVVTVTVNDGGADVTARRVYRTQVNGSQKYFLRQVSRVRANQFCRHDRR